MPGCVVRHSAYIAPDVVLMPCFVNLGAHVERGTMIDTWATVGSCAQIGRNVHISGGAGIGGVLEPLQAEPVIIEDDCFIGARSEVAEGVIVEQGAVLAMGTFIGASTKIVDRASGEIHRGRVPAYSVVVPGTLPGGDCPTGRPGPGARLRGDRQAGRRQDPRQDLDQRAAACMIELTDPVALTQALIRCPSMTPDDAGALDVVEDALARLGFRCHRLTFEAPGTAPVGEPLRPPRRAARPHLAFAGHTDVVPPGDLASLARRPVRRRARRTATLYGRGAVDMKGAIACFVAAVARASSASIGRPARSAA